MGTRRIKRGGKGSQRAAAESIRGGKGKGGGRIEEAGGEKKLIFHAEKRVSLFSGFAAASVSVGTKAEERRGEQPTSPPHCTTQDSIVVFCAAH